MEVAIIDYKRSNLFNIVRALEVIGAENIKIISNGKSALTADRMILPGVGAFGDAMKDLQEKKLDSTIREFAQTGKPLLGICLGMQLLLNSSMEFGNHAGLGLIPGEVKPLRNFLPDTSIKIPHISWNELIMEETPDQLDEHVLTSLLTNIPQKASFYFTHSLVSVPENPEHTISKTEYANHLFCSILKKNNILGCQFHPERSGNIGLQFLKNFIFNFN
jgi:imidazole glycerol-phosphate synthase subunit HisH